MLNQFDGIIDLLRSDGSIIVNKNLAFEIGLEPAIVYVELLGKYQYFKSNNMLTEDGYFYNTIDDFRLDTTLLDKRQRKAIKELEELNLFKTDLRGLPPKRHFKPVQNTEKVLNLINKGKEKRDKLAEKLAEKTDKSKIRYFGRFNSFKMEETNTPKRHVNNTNRTILSNNNNKTYVAPKKSTEATHIFLDLYEQYTNEKHKPIRQDKLEDATQLLNEIYYNVDNDIFIRQLNRYFENFDYEVDGEKRFPVITYFEKTAFHYFADHCRKVFYQQD